MMHVGARGGFCALCGTPFRNLRRYHGCRTCGSTDIPCANNDQVDVEINWQELHTLCVWAERFAEIQEHAHPSIAGRDLVYAIANRLRRQHPERAPLTLADEFGARRRAGLAVNPPQDCPDERIPTQPDSES